MSVAKQAHSPGVGTQRQPEGLLGLSQPPLQPITGHWGSPKPAWLPCALPTSCSSLPETARGCPGSSHGPGSQPSAGVCSVGASHGLGSGCGPCGHCMLKSSHHVCAILETDGPHVSLVTFLVLPAGSQPLPPSHTAPRALALWGDGVLLSQSGSPLKLWLASTGVPHALPDCSSPIAWS